MSSRWSPQEVILPARHPGPQPADAEQNHETEGGVEDHSVAGGGTGHDGGSLKPKGAVYRCLLDQGTRLEKLLLALLPVAMFSLLHQKRNFNNF